MAKKQPRQPRRDAFGRFLAKGAPRLPKAKTPKPRRSVLGRFLSREQIQLQEQEQTQRILELARMTPDEYAAFHARELRAAEVKAEKESRYERFQARPARYREDSARTDRDSASIDEDKLPSPIDSYRHVGGLYEYIWVWQGPHAVETARRFLYLVHQQQQEGKLPKDLRGYFAAGDGQGKNATWIGSRYAAPLYIARHMQTLFTSQSGNTVALMQLPHAERDSAIWAEVKLTTQEGVFNVGNVKRIRGTTKRKPGKVGRSSGRTRKRTRQRR